MAELGLSRRTLLKGGLGIAAGAGLAATVGVQPAQAGLNKLAKANAHPVGGIRPGGVLPGQFTGPGITGRFGIPFVDLCIPVQTGGQLLFVGGDSYSGAAPAVATNDWRCPTGLLSNSANPLTAGVSITGAITDTANHAKAFTDTAGNVIEGHANGTTAIPSDVFACNGKLYMHLMRGPIYDTHHTDFWSSADGGNSWTYLRQWPRDLYGYQFQQKTYAADTSPSDPYVYCLTTIFNRGIQSGLLLFRVFKSDLDKTDADANASGYGAFYAYQGWGYANGSWAWGNQPTTITDVRTWGEICFRAMGGKYVFSWFQANTNNDLADIRAQVFPLPTSNLFTTTEQTMVYNSGNNPSSDPNSVLPAPYGGYIIPGSTFQNFNFVVSRWINQPGYDYSRGDNYCCFQYQTSLNPTI